MRERIFEIVGPARQGDKVSRTYDIFIVLVALLSLVPLVFDESRLSPTMLWAVKTLDICMVYILIADYTLRWITHDLKTKKGWKSLLIYPFTPIAVIDALSILPSLGVIPQAFLFLRILRVIKVFRYSKNLIVVTNACAREARTLFSVFLAVVVYMFTVALIVFTCEPEAFANYFDAVCWAATQMTSVSFSESRPAGYLGKALSITCSLVALLVVALPAGIITAAYITEIRESKTNSSNYFAMTSSARLRLRDLRRPSVWLRENLKALRYLTVMALCMLITLGYMTLGNLLGFSGSICILGVAFATLMLEPAAGIIVSLMICSIGAVLFQQADFVLYMTEYSFIVFVIGFTVPRVGNKHFALRVAASMVLMVFGLGILDSAIAFVRGGYTVSGAFAIQSADIALTGVLAGSGLNPWPATVLGTIITYSIDTAVSAAIFLVLVFGFGLRAAPSEAERHQQQQILLERALRQQEIESAEARSIAKETLQSELRKLLEEREERERSIELVEKRLAELEQSMAGESPASAKSKSK